MKAKEMRELAEKLVEMFTHEPIFENDRIARHNFVGNMLHPARLARWGGTVRVGDYVVRSSFHGSPGFVNGSSGEVIFMSQQFAKDCVDAYRRRWPGSRLQVLLVVME